VTDRLASPTAVVLDELVERVAVRVAELVADRLPAAPEGSPWLNVDEAADYLRCGRKRIYDLVSQSRVPVHRDATRLLFRREDLDEYVLGPDDTR
jgi:excisionase family DNA binding protein